MDNQHRQIKGYRELDAQEIESMNAIKTKAQEVGELIDQLDNMDQFDKRWAAIARTQLQQGFMALTRAIAKPDFF